jgi:maleate isomerase
MQHTNVASGSPAARLSSQVRLGVILPSVNTVAEPWMHTACTDVASIHTARMLMPDVLTPASIVAMDEEDGPRAVAQIMSCRPAVIGYACAASSMVQGLEHDRHLQQEMEARSGRPCVTAMGAIGKALRAIGVDRISLVSPYGPVIASAERRYLESMGFEVVREQHLGIESAFDLACPSPQEIYEIAIESDAPESQGVLLSCMNFPAHQVIEKLEGKTGKPIVTATQALLWSMLRLAGITSSIAGGGRLFEIR